MTAGTEPLFPLAADNVAVTSDDCHTPAWVFDGGGQNHNESVAVLTLWHVPARLAKANKHGAVLYGRSAA